MRIPLRISLCLLAAALIAVIGAVSLQNDTAPATANVNDVTHVKWGDSNCDNNLDGADLTALMQNSLGIPQSVNSCANGLGIGTQIQTFDASNTVNYSGY